ncbi:Rad53p [Rhizophagus irregularis DAOM 197198w]|uniref:Rad53p n=3 Tax=Rhizophagus irregularis TaxID=588596 RepID=A0A015IZF8_RHIIW|nr:Rad53p [Rhizophagus irregularis DAOM 197198w]
MAKNNNNTVIMYTEIWKNGPLYYENKWISKSNEKVVLNYLAIDIKEFFNKVNKDNNYKDIYGISQNPDTKNYFIILNDKKCIPWLILQNNFTNLSGNEIIDDFIQKMQLKINNWIHRIVEWIPYDQFTDIKEIEKVDDNAAITYSAIWKNGPLFYRYDKKEWIRNSNKKVILNCLALDIEEFLYEAYKYNNSIYGISQNPNTNDYILILQNRNCKRCGKPYSDLKNKWCKLCIQNNFANWSGNEKIDNFIQEKQIKMNSFNNIVVEWIPYNQFIDIKEIGKVENNVAIIHSAIWKNGPLYHKEDRKEWIRNSYKKVVLKCLTLDINKFLIEANNYNDMYGISQNPNTNDYILVFQIDQYCNRCCKPYSNLKKKWCKSCQINYIQNNLTNWSGNQKINDFIREMQLKIDDYHNIIFEWIPYDQFDYIEEVGKGGFATIYSAIWKVGPLNYYKGLYERDNYNKEVALKCINNSHNITDEFLNEVKAYSITGYEYNNVLKVYGISQNPITENHIIVLQYAKCGSINNWMHYFYKDFDHSTKYSLFIEIFYGLKEIHQKQMFHQDFHIGNILVNNNVNFEGIPLGIHISDMGLCGEVGDKNKTKIYGVMPYVAPEVLRGNLYTQAADIYSFGMVMYYIITGRQPFENCAHDGLLALDICRGIRPEIPEIPELKSNWYIDLMKKCWDSNPDIRPNVDTMLNVTDYDLINAIEQAEKYLFKDYKENNQLTTTHPQAIYTSRLLNPYTEGLATDFTE